MGIITLNTELGCLADSYTDLVWNFTIAYVKCMHCFDIVVLKLLKMCL